MKTLLLSSAALIAFTGIAAAADLPARTMAPAPAPFIAPPMFTWTGFYGGVNLGAGFNVRDDRDETLRVNPITIGAATFPGGTVRYPDNSEDLSFTGGGQIGYNYQFGSFVVGAEADIQFLGIDDDDMVRGSFNQANFPNTYLAPQRGVTGIDWFGTVRLRAGYAFDRVLVYGTGGLAYAEGGATRRESFANGNRFILPDDSDVEFGWTLGAGVDYAWTDNLIVGLEGLYVNIDRDSKVDNFGGTYRNPDDATGALQAATAVGDRNDDIEFGVVRVRLNYKF